MRISLDNGRTFLTAAMAMVEIDIRHMWMDVLCSMEPAICDAVAYAVMPCSELEFLREYLNRATEHLIISY